MRRNHARRLLVLALAAASCGRPSGPTSVSEIRDAHRLRVLGKLQADRDSAEGYREAAAIFTRVVELSPGTASDRLSLSKALLFTGDLDRCQRELEEARSRFLPEELPPDVDYVGGLLEKRRSRIEEALAHFQRVLERKPAHFPSWFQRAALEEQANRLEPSEQSYRKVLELAPSHQAAAYRLSLVLRRLKRDDEAMKMLELFRSIGESESAETEKCDLTSISLRPFERRSVEPPEARVEHTDVTKQVLGDLGAGMSHVSPMRFGVEGHRGALMSGAAGARVARFARGLVTQVGMDRAPGTPGSFDVLSAAGDLDNDGLDDAVFVTGEGVTAWRAGSGGTLAENGRIQVSSGRPGCPALYDADHDGDLDVILLVAKGDRADAVILRNNGEMSFAALTPFGQLEAGASAAASHAHAIAAHDVDQANDIDFIFAGGATGVQAFLNRRDGSFLRVPLPSLGARSIVLVEDLNNDGAPDFFAAGGGAGWTHAMNADRGGSPYALRLEPAQVVQETRCGEVRDATAADVDNDGDLDVLVAASAGVALLRNAQGGSLREETAVPIGDGGTLAVAAIDVNDDGALEILATPAPGGIQALAVKASPAYASMTLLPRGTRDNQDGVGAVVEVYAGRAYQSLLVRSAGGLHVGLGVGGRNELDGLRIRWPQGIIQSIPAAELVLDVQGEARIRQKEGLVASCPFLYARSSTGWRFLTDVLGIAPLDEWMPAGESAKLDPEELVRIEPGCAGPVDGLLRFAVTEELRETAYLDRVELITIEHPADSDVYTDESTRQERYGPLKLIVVRRSALSAPASLALSGNESPVDLVRARDGTYAHGYPATRPQWGGWVEPYAMEFPVEWRTGAVLLTGRVAWYDSTVAFSLAQSGRAWSPLRLEMDRGAGFELVEADLGVPTGMDRTIVAFLPQLAAGEKARLRLTSQYRLLWDRVLLAADVEKLDPLNLDALSRDVPREIGRPLSDGATLKALSTRPRRAALQFHGFSRVVGDSERHEAVYSYEDATPGGAFPPAAGHATRHGDVTPLLDSHDDLLAVLATGDGVEVDFPAPAPPAAGRAQTFFLRISGWAKEGSFHNGTGGRVGPLPTRGMSRYPPREEDARRDAAYRDYLSSYQTREIRARER